MWHTGSSLRHAGPSAGVHRLSGYAVRPYVLRDTWGLSPPARDQTHTPCRARWMLKHWTTNDVLGGRVLTSKPQASPLVHFSGLILRMHFLHGSTVGTEALISAPCDSEQPVMLPLRAVGVTEVTAPR